MAGMSRRAFLASVAALAAGWRLPPDRLGAVLAAPLRPAEAPSTLVQTIRQSATATGQGSRDYRVLVTAPGEPHLVRTDLVGAGPSAARTRARRSLLYLGHLSDIHLMDAQSPARLEPMAGQSPDLWEGAIRPQDALTVHVLAQMVAAVGDVRTSPVTGAPLGAAVVTGDSADMHSELELRWYIDALDGRTVTANSGAPGVYEGVQVWPEATYAWQPEDPAGRFGDYGFPRLPGMLAAAVSTPVPSRGVPAPWYAVYGNHDTTFLGTLAVNEQLRAWAVGGRKAVTWQALAREYLGQHVADASPFQRLLDSLVGQRGVQPGIRSVTADPARKLFDQADFMRAHLDSPAVPGPVGHGFTRDAVESGRTWWSADLPGRVRALGLDTCNQVAGPDGAVPDDQFTWLRAELERAQSEKRLVVVLSHHNSATLENGAQPALGGGQALHHAEEVVALLGSYPCCVAWINGHTHINTVVAHRSREDGGGFWEITTASCIDFPQQQQTVEVVDNRDGTLSLFTTALDHAGPAAWTPGDYSPAGLAGLSRELAANDWIEDPLMRLGSALDRNCELLLAAPFDLSQIADAELERERATARARLLAWEGRSR